MQTHDSFHAQPMPQITVISSNTLPTEPIEEIDHQKLMWFFQHRFNFLVAQRTSELSEAFLNSEDQEEQIRLDRERKALSLAHLQSRVRSKVSAQIQKIVTREIMKEPSTSGTRRQRRREVQLEELKKKKWDMDDCHRSKHSEFIESVLSHRKAFIEFHTQRAQQVC